MATSRLLPEAFSVTVGTAPSGALTPPMVHGMVATPAGTMPAGGKGPVNPPKPPARHEALP